MIIKQYAWKLNGAPLALMIFLIAFSCKRLPEPGFSYTPVENPEAGDTIQFNNETKNGTTFFWDFGNGGSSTLENPTYIYGDAGIYSVRLTATNDMGEESILQPVTIYEPTVLGFVVSDSTGSQQFSGAEVWVYNSQADWQDLNIPLILGSTDQDGFVYFFNMEAIAYHIWAFKEDTGGVWLFGGFTPVIDLNKVNLFNVPCKWVPNEKKASGTHRSSVRLQMFQSNGELKPVK